mgnify:FL=1
MPKDKMGQNGPKGAPDPAAVKAVEAANQKPSNSEIKDSLEFANGETTLPDAVVEEQMESIVSAILKRPDIANKILQAAATTPEGRSLMRIEAGRGTPTGHYYRDYANEKQLRVHGGSEVVHPPEFVPKPPAYIKQYIARIGGETDYIDDAECDPVTGDPLLTPHYKLWLDKKMEGGRLDSDVAMESSSALAADGSPAVTVGEDGAPATTDHGMV